jgi:hypothetical protein
MGVARNAAPISISKPLSTAALFLRDFGAIQAELLTPPRLGIFN